MRPWYIIPPVLLGVLLPNPPNPLLCWAVFWPKPLKLPPNEVMAGDWAVRSPQDKISMDISVDDRSHVAIVNARVSEGEATGKNRRACSEGARLDVG